MPAMPSPYIGNSNSNIDNDGNNHSCYSINCENSYDDTARTVTVTLAVIIITIASAVAVMLAVIATTITIGGIVAIVAMAAATAAMITLMMLLWMNSRTCS
jgi:hypothetical protein